jgi:preprotein translocase subunit SecE
MEWASGRETMETLALVLSLLFIALLLEYLWEYGQLTITAATK